MLMDILDIIVFQQYQLYYIYEVGYWVKVGNVLCLGWYVFDGCKQIVYQNEDDEEKLGNEYGLLLCFCYGIDEQFEVEDDEQV